MKRIKLEHWKVISIYLMLYDIVAVNVAYFGALAVRFDFMFSHIPKEYLVAFLKFAPVYTIFVIIVMHGLNLYNSLWRYASFNELNYLVASLVITSIFQIIGITVFVQRMPLSYYIIGALIQFVLTTSIRFLYRYIQLQRSQSILHAPRTGNYKNIMVIGAGDAGRIVVRDLKVSKQGNFHVCCVIDDCKNKWNRRMMGTPIVGGRDVILSMVERYSIDTIMLAIPSATAQEKRDILNICKETDCELRTLPGVYQFAQGEVSLQKMRPVAVEDLLGRETVKINMDEVIQTIQGKVILVTGGGGSIGSELCRQIASRKPKQLIIFDVYENNAYDIQQELKRTYKDELNLEVLIGSVRDSKRIDMVFEKYHPQLVFHAAAHKHVPLMETSPCESIKNNVFGTYKTAYAAMKYGAERFVLISTDKAVNPTNIMGASKRLCEMVIQSMDAISRNGKMDILPILSDHNNGETEKILQSGESLDLDMTSVKNKNRKGTQFVAVRFGNVLGSNGSVIPLFRKQIEAGGPVTVTHPDIVRYFMTIPEAVSLVLQAETYAWGGEIFVLDMGEQVKIDTLARNMIRLSGYEPDVDIKVEYSGLRPGEKLFEERLMEEEGMRPTENEKIHIGKPIPFKVEEFLVELRKLADASYNNSEDVVKIVEEIVPTFHPVGENPTGMEMVRRG